jgi:hypothetical protein
VAAAADGARTLAAAGIPAMALKGLRLSAVYVQDYSLRPMGDVDFLVPAPSIRDAVRVLGAAGWERSSNFPIERALTRVHEVGLRRGSGEAIDLHWRPLEASWDLALDDALWRRATPAEVAGAPMWLSAPEDLLFHVLVHGVRGYPERVVRWPLDAALILEHEPALDWSRLAAEAEARRMTAMAADALRYLGHLGVPVPQDAVARLERARPTLVEKVERGLGPKQHGAWWVARFEAANYLRKSATWPVHRRLTGIPAYLAAWWGVPVRSLPGEFGRRAAARVRRRPHA